jgi:zinc protease
MDMARVKARVQQPISGYVAHGVHKGIEEYELKKNGLRLLYHYDDTAAVAGLMVTYLVGSRHEAVGYTGATHLLEHLMFKGSKKFPPKHGTSALDQLSELGALVNASTWFDRTNYYEVLPVEHFEHVVELEADRMRNAIITEHDRAAEMPAVRSEYAFRVENAPEEFLDEKIWATAFMAHPYHHPTIGWRDDFENVSVERLQHFYDTYYWPNNAVVTISGAVERNEALRLVKKYFGVHPRSPHPIPEPYTTEPKQTGRRFVEVNRAGAKNIVGLGYKVPEGVHADMPALMVLATILADGVTSRLHRALVEKKQCMSVQSILMPLKDPSLLLFYATLAGDVAHGRVEAVVAREIAQVQKEGVSAAELAKVLANIQTEMTFARDGHYAMLSVLNEAIAAGDWKYFFELPKKIQAVTVADVKRVAKTYLMPEQVTAGYYRADKK